jgi:hypothetical protein
MHNLADLDFLHKIFLKYVNSLTSTFWLLQRNTINMFHMTHESLCNESLAFIALSIKLKL